MNTMRMLDSTSGMRRKGFTLLEGTLIFASVALISVFGASMHRWMWAQAEWGRYRTTMQELTATVRTMPSRALAKRRTMHLRIDAARGTFQVTSAQGSSRTYTTVERTIWLPDGLEILEAPEALTASATGRLSAGAIVVAAPAYDRLFRVTTSEAGVVKLHEESTL